MQVSSASTGDAGERGDGRWFGRRRGGSRGGRAGGGARSRLSWGGGWGGSRREGSNWGWVGVGRGRGELEMERGRLGGGVRWRWCWAIVGVSRRWEGAELEPSPSSLRSSTSPAARARWDGGRAVCLGLGLGGGVVGCWRRIAGGEVEPSPSSLRSSSCLAARARWEGGRGLCLGLVRGLGLVLRLGLSSGMRGRRARVWAARWAVCWSRASRVAAMRSGSATSSAKRAKTACVEAGRDLGTGEAVMGG